MSVLAIVKEHSVYLLSTKCFYPNTLDEYKHSDRIFVMMVGKWFGPIMLSVLSLKHSY
jgi:hypothetical protein